MPLTAAQHDQAKAELQLVDELVEKLKTMPTDRQRLVLNSVGDLLGCWPVKKGKGMASGAANGDTDVRP